MTTSHSQDSSTTEVEDFQFHAQVYTPKLEDTLEVDYGEDGAPRWEKCVVFYVDETCFKVVSISDLDVQVFAKDALSGHDIRRAAIPATAVDKKCAAFMRAVHVHQNKEDFPTLDQALLINGYKIVHSYVENRGRASCRSGRRSSTYVYAPGSNKIQAKGLKILPSLFFDEGSALHVAAKEYTGSDSGDGSSARKTSPNRSKRRSSGGPSAAMQTPPPAAPPLMPALTPQDVLAMTNEAGEAGEEVKRLTEQRDIIMTQAREQLNTASGDGFDEALASANKRRHENKDAIEAAETEHAKKRNKAGLASDLFEAQKATKDTKDQTKQARQKAEEARREVEAAEREEKEAEEKVSHLATQFQTA